MTDMVQRLIDVMNDSARRSRGDYHLTLGRAIEALAQSDLPVTFDFDEKSPSHPHSYRGYYSDLALESVSAPITASALRDLLSSALNQTFTGYKGGDYLMGPDTPLWAAEYGHGSGRAIVGIRNGGLYLVLVTKELQSD
mgnify:FL=1